MAPHSRNRRLLLAVLAPSALGVAAIVVSRANAAVTAIADGGSRVAAERRFWNDWRVSLWEVLFSVDDTAEIVGPKGKARRVTRFSDMHYFVGPFPDMMVTPSPIWGSYFHTILDGAAQAEIDTKSAGRPRLPKSVNDETKRELLVGRNVKLCADEISVETEGARRYSWPEPNTFVISNNFDWPTATTTYYSPPGKPVTSVDVNDAAPLLTLTEQEVPYKYRELVNQGRATLPPVPGVGGFRQISRTINYSIVRQETMTLEFLPQCRPDGARPTKRPPETPECVPNLVGDLSTCRACKVVSDNYAIDNTSSTPSFIHPNVEVRLKIGDEDVTHFMMPVPGGDPKHFEPVRRHRVWVSGLASNDEPNGRYTVDDTRRSVNSWIEDNTTTFGTGVRDIPNWYDMPAPFDKTPPNWPRKSTLQEFLLGVKNFPEFGFLYYATMVDTKPGWYRVRKSKAEHITEDDWCSIKRSPGARWNGQGALDDTKWQPVPPR
jgi:hypothetical protein